MCTDGHVESNGKCEKMLNFAADYETVCINGGVMRNGDCWYPQPTKTHAIGVCPSGYKYYRAGFGGEIGYCKDFTNNVKTEATFTCDGIVSVDNPKLAITSTHAYCEGNSWSFLDPNNQPLSKLEYSCPAGYTVDGSRCIGIHTQEMDTEFSCPYRYSVIPYGSFAMCGPIENIRKDTLTIEYYCPKDGFKNLILQGNKCYIEKSH